LTKYRYRERFPTSRVMLFGKYWLKQKLSKPSATRSSLLGAVAVGAQWAARAFQAEEALYATDEVGVIVTGPPAPSLGGGVMMAGTVWIRAEWG
jgi:hypothetical protein